MKKRIAAVVLAVAMMMTGNAMAFTFTEVPSEDIFSPEIIEKEKISSWAKSEIEQAREAGLVTEHTEEYMTHNISRFQFAELIVNMTELVLGEEIVPAAEDTFTDCSEEAVLKAYAVGIVNGKTVGENPTFAPDENCTREQIAAMIYRAWQYIGERTDYAVPTDNSAFANYADKSKVSAYAAEAVGVLATCEVMKGVSNTELAPKKACSIEQCILLIFRLYQRF